MRILHAVEYYAPSRGGAQEVVRRISEGMAAQGHDVTVATSAIADRASCEINGVRIREFDVTGNHVRGIEGDADGYRTYLTETPFDVIMTYAAQQWTTDLMFDAVDDIRGPVVCAPCGYSGLWDPRYRRYFATLPDKLRKLDATVYHSTDYQDIRFAREHKLSDVHVIPNGAAASEFAVRDDEAVAALRREHGIEGPLVLTVGSHTGIKGHRQCLAAFALAPTGPATLMINGNGAPRSGCTDSCLQLSSLLRPLLARRGKRVVVCDLDRQDLITAYHAADLFLLLSRVECSPVVLFEALAAGTPFLSSDIGNAAEIARNTRGGSIVKTLGHPIGRPVVSPVASSRRLAKLIGDPARRAAMGEAGRAAWRKHHTWEGLTDAYLSLYRDVIAGRATGSVAA